MKKFSLSLCFVCLLSFVSHAQLMVAKLVGKDAARYGVGYGLFVFYDIPFANQENKSIRIELMDLALFVTKGENLFTSTGDGKGYISIKVGYKYVFSETQAGFYISPSAGYCRAVIIKENEDATYGDGFAAALEGGYSLAVGEYDNSFNFGLKYEYDHGNATHIIQSVGFRVSYSFRLFRRNR